jgi:hypothetical protein
MQFGHIISVDNVNEALPVGLQHVRQYGILFESRGMDTVEVPGPVSTVYHNPTRRVLFDEVRDANPFFHLMESLWIIGGSNKVDLPEFFLGSITQFSDNGESFHGAYGHRLRHAFGFDQLDRAVDLFLTKPDTRQVVLSIWHPELDLGKVTKDMPCNDMIMLGIRHGLLHMTVCNRSNDVIWGAYGANAVQFSMLQEWLAAMIDVKVGRYVQQSNSYHVYTSNPYWQAFTRGEGGYGHVSNPYMRNEVKPMPLASSREEAEEFRKDCELLCHAAETSGDLLVPLYRTPFFQGVVRPLVLAYEFYQKRNFDEALSVAEACKATDWRLACVQWLQRRKDRASAKAAA